MEFKELIGAFGEKAMGAEIKPDEEGCVRLTIDGMLVTMREFPEVSKLLTYGEVGDVPPEGAGLLAETLLRANFMFKATAGATLSQNEQTKKYCLCRYDDLKLLDQEAFEKMMETFANTLDQWRAIVADYRPDESPKAMAETEPRGLEAFMFLRA